MVFFVVHFRPKGFCSRINDKDLTPPPVTTILKSPYQIHILTQEISDPIAGFRIQCTNTPLFVVLMVSNHI